MGSGVQLLKTINTVGEFLNEITQGEGGGGQRGNFVSKTATWNLF